MTFSLEGFDVNGNGFLDGQEIVNFEENSKKIFGEYDQTTAWMDSKMDGDNKTITKTELAQFLLHSKIFPVKKVEY